MPWVGPIYWYQVDQQGACWEVDEVSRPFDLSYHTDSAQLSATLLASTAFLWGWLTNTRTHTLINTLTTGLLTLTLSTTCCLLHSTLKEKGWVCVLNLTTHWWCRYFNEECGQDYTEVKPHHSCRYISQATDNRRTTHDILFYFLLWWCFIKYAMFSHPPEHLHVTVAVDIHAFHFQNILEAVWNMLKRNNTFDLFIHSPEGSIRVLQ